MIYDQNQNLNDWNKMLSDIYDKTQNYSKTPFELHSHLTEVTGGFGRLLLKKRDYDKALTFIPKIFGWLLALIRKMKGDYNIADIEKIIIDKFPGVCPYCLTTPCKCTEKGTLNVQLISDLAYKYYHNSEASKSLRGFQSMFTGIYKETWNRYKQVNKKRKTITIETENEIAFYNTAYLHSRMVEELSEIAESIRFYHLYRTNFDNEVADFIAWLFAIISSYHNLYISDKNKTPEQIFIDDILWNAYPGFCISCGLTRCDCRSGPVRELLSKPSVIEFGFYDEETQTSNKAKLIEYINSIELKKRSTIFPITAIKILIANYNDLKSERPDELHNLTSAIRSKIRQERDKLFRNNYAELIVLSEDTTLEEASGLQKRISKAIEENKFVSVNFEINHFEDINSLSTLKL